MDNVRPSQKTKQLDRVQTRWKKSRFANRSGFAIHKPTTLGRIKMIRRLQLNPGFHAPGKLRGESAQLQQSHLEKMHDKL
jgi:hypothetical protein